MCSSSSAAVTTSNCAAGNCSFVQFAFENFKPAPAYVVHHMRRNVDSLRLPTILSRGFEQDRPRHNRYPAAGLFADKARTPP